MRFTLFALAALVAVGCAGARAETLFEIGAKWSYYKGNDHPSGGDLEWTEADFDDSDWPSGASPIRYGDGNGGTVLGAMYSTGPVGRMGADEAIHYITYRENIRREEEEKAS